MSPGEMLPGQMSWWQLKSVLYVHRNLLLKFGQNWVSNSWDIRWGFLLSLLLWLLLGKVKPNLVQLVLNCRLELSLAIISQPRAFSTNQLQPPPPQEFVKKIMWVCNTKGSFAFYPLWKYLNVLNIPARVRKTSWYPGYLTICLQLGRTQSNVYLVQITRQSSTKATAIRQYYLGEPSKKETAKLWTLSKPPLPPPI